MSKISSLYGSAPLTESTQIHCGISEADPIGNFYSQKNKRNIPFWSSLDLKFCMLAEHAGTIIGFDARPELVMLRVSGRNVPFVADFRVFFDGKSVLIGLLPAERSLTIAERRICMIAHAHYARRGEAFVNMSDDDLARCANRDPLFKMAA